MMDYSDEALLKGITEGDQKCVLEVLRAFERGDRGAYNLLVNLLKQSEPHVENALRDSFAEGDGLVAELICQAYYPFVEALCGYKFKGKTPQEITDITNSVLGDFVKGAASLNLAVSMKNTLYQRVCARYKDYLNSESVNSFGHEIPERKLEAVNATIENVKAEAARTSEEMMPAAQAPDVAAYQAGTGMSALPKPRRSGSRPEEAARTAANPKLEKAAAQAVAAAAANLAQAEGSDMPSVLPVLTTANKGPRLAGYPSESHEAKHTDAGGAKLVKAMSRLSERDFDTYQTIVLHYFGRRGYQELCQELGGKPIVDVGRTLCQGLLALGREIFGL